MPLYEYRCKSCGREFTELSGVVSDSQAPSCTACGSQELEKLVSRFRAGRDETQRVVSATDALEATDPGDDDNDVTKEGVDTYIVDATVNIRDLNRSQDWEFPTDGPKTLNGLIVEMLETIPAPKTRLTIGGYPIEIVESDDNRVRAVRVGLREIAEPEED